jgi:hypothetical protein
MKKLDAKAHGVLDYIVVVVFAVAPLILGLEGIARTLSFALAAIHLALTAVTSFPLGLVKLVPFPIHGWIERIVGPVLVLVPFVLGFSDQMPAMVFYVVMGVGIILVGLVTDYRAVD